MKHKRFGFTIIEVAIFLAISGLLFAGIIAGTQNSLWNQRFNDSNQNFAEFLRSIYSKVSNPQSIGDGRSDIAIYGKLVVFGESVGLDGADINKKETQKVFVYDVVGDVSGTGTGNAKLLKQLKVNVVTAVEWWDSKNIKRIAPAGMVESYSPRWAAAIEKTSGELFTGSILIVRHPRSGTINTLVSPDIIEVNKTVRAANISFSNKGGYNISDLLTSKLQTFNSETIDFCINPYGVGTNGRSRRDVRLVEGARNASGVEMLDLDGEDNKCQAKK